MAKTRVMIADDEALARARLRDLLLPDTGTEVVGEAADGREALERIRELRPDIVFLDIQMPEVDGLGVASELTGGKGPVVIFVTAHDQFAVKAFELHAVDYLLKPFDAERLQLALDRARARLAGPPAGSTPDWRAVLSAVKPSAAEPGRLWIKADGRMILVSLEEVDWVESADNYVVIHVGKDSFIQRETLSAMEGRLPSRQFVRISRSTIVNVGRIREVQPLFHGEQAVILKSGARLTMTRSYRGCLDTFGIG